MHCTTIAGDPSENQVVLSIDPAEYATRASPHALPLVQQSQPTIPRDSSGRVIDVPPGHTCYSNVVPPHARRTRYTDPATNTDKDFWVFSTHLTEYQNEDQALWVVIDQFKHCGPTLIDSVTYKKFVGTFTSMCIVAGPHFGIDAIVLSPMSNLMNSAHHDGGRCALSGCGISIAPGVSRCSRCKTAQYCCKDHQRAHYATHRNECEVIAHSIEQENNRVLLTAPPSITASTISQETMQQLIRESEEKLQAAQRAAIEQMSEQ
jgi:hypothetical protein